MLEFYFFVFGVDGCCEFDVFGELNRFVYFFLYVDERAESFFERRFFVREIVV